MGAELKNALKKALGKDMFGAKAITVTTVQWAPQYVFAPIMMQKLYACHAKPEALKYQNFLIDISFLMFFVKF